MSATKKLNSVQLWDAFVAANEEYVRADAMRQKAHEAYQKSLKRMSNAQLEAKLKEVWPEGVMQQVSKHWFRFKPFKDKPWGSITHLESSESTLKEALASALDKAIMNGKVK